MSPSITTVELSAFPANSNPFQHDSYHMGTKLGSNVTIMYENHSDAKCKYLIICNTVTGERIKVLFDGAENKPNIVEMLVNFANS